MANYVNDWIGLDRGHEGIWNPSIWAGVIQSVYDCGGTVNSSDFSSLFYQKLKTDFPSVSWTSKDKNGSDRSLFRDAREPWTSTGALEFGENEITMTEIGLSVINGNSSYSDILVETFKQYKEPDSEDNPFAIICECLLSLPVGDSLSLDDVVKVMRHWRPENDDGLADVLAAESENVGGVTERRIRSILALLSYAGAVLALGKEYFIASRSVAEEIAHKLPKNEINRRCCHVQNDLWQLITYGAPGTGKSHRTKLEIEGHAVYRTTFHPDSDYSTFVGAYKPKMKLEQRINCIDDKAKEVKDKDGKPSMQDVIAYDFVPQAFIKAYVDAWQRMNDAKASGGTPDPVFLVIEEINRGNCAQIFGDLFQLLDRNEEGYSEYAIDADADLARWLGKQFDGAAGGGMSGHAGRVPLPDVFNGKKLVLPPNLYIRATMNTSDQSLFPIDSAFKRRWEWKYVPIAKPTEAGWKDRAIVADGKKYDWWEFLKIANAQILETTKSEDKQLGYFFVKVPDATGHIKADRFTGKVLFYLYNDVFKDYSLPATLFGDGTGDSIRYEFKMFFDEYGETIEKVVAAFLDQLKIPSEILASADATERVPPNGD